MKRARRRWAGGVALLGAVLVTCRSKSGIAPPAPPSGVASAVKELGSAPPRSAQPSFRNDILPVLTRECATASGCHGDAPTDSVHLDLRPATAYRELVGHEAEARRGALRVKAGDPAHSFLIMKLTGTLDPTEGKAMPLDVDTGAPVMAIPILASFRSDFLEPWIAAGAPDN